MRYLIFLLALLLMITGISISSSYADEAEIRALLEERDQEIKEILGPEDRDYSEEERERLKNIINDIVDYPSMARQALDEKYEELSSEEQERFTELFSEVIRKQSMDQLDIYRAEVVYEEIEVDENSEAMVHTTSIHDGRRIPVKYKMTYRDGEWVIADISVDEVWTAESYQRSFSRILRRHGFDRLMESLEQRAARG